MAKILVDTSAWIEFYHRQGAQSVKRALSEALERHEIAVVAPVVVELLQGAKTKDAYKTLHDDLRALLCLPVGWEESVIAAKLGWELRKAGRPVPTIDLLIAAGARQHKYEIWHFGDEHFKVIEAAGGPPQRDLKAL
uniref:Ribonuclease VapC n=1 Tax=uncultured Acetothermia bacterium TaxID=236499 RepID=H5SH43_9BACT|nr:PilT domain-containing protein [uncultured Acetothermia bacterium]